MSQYGAFGFAEQGRGYKEILRHYYKGVAIGKADTGDRPRAAHQRPRVAAVFSGATRACGETLNADKRYSFGVAGGGVELNRSSGARIKRCGDEGKAVGGGAVRFSGVGALPRQADRPQRRRQPLRDQQGRGSRTTSRAWSPNEIPGSWPAAALRAQAVVARSYGLATRVNGDGYDLYDDTRSQVYGGKSVGDRPDQQSRRKATAGEVIKAGGGTATAYFFSTSGGETENSEFVFAEPRSYLKAVNDPYDRRSPVHSWRLRLSNAEMKSKLVGPVLGQPASGSRVLKTGRSPRIVRAKVVGSNGSTNVSGDTLQFRLGLRSTWARFKKR